MDDFEQPHENLMDRLSNRIGSFVPGCSRLPPRHPVKVCLVLAYSGILAGWSGVAALLMIYAIIGHELVMLLVAACTGFPLGISQLIPLLIWMDKSNDRCFVAPFAASTATMIQLALYIQIDDYSPQWEILITAIGGLLQAVFGLFLLNVWSFRAIAFSVLIGVSCGIIRSWLEPEATLHFIPILSQYIPMQFQYVAWMGFNANNLSLFCIGIGVSLSTVIWDRTPAPTFLAESGSAESVASD